MNVGMWNAYTGRRSDERDVFVRIGRIIIESAEADERQKQRTASKQGSRKDAGARIRRKGSRAKVGD